MNINPVGINAYRQLDTDNQTARRQNAEKTTTSTVNPEPVEISGQTAKTGSALGIRVNRGAFEDILTAQEKEALEMVFEKFRSAAALTATYERDGQSEKTQLGKIVDVTL